MKWTLRQRMQRWLTWNILSRAMRVKIEGAANIPASGPYILVWNHLHISDGMLLWSRTPVPTAFMATDKFKGKNWVVHTYLSGAGGIWVRHDRIDREAIRQALAALRAGVPIAIAPEGKISQTGALCPAEPGVASLVCHSGVPVLPVAVWGQHRAHKTWVRFRRPRVTIRYGAPVHFEKAAPTAANTRRITAEIMNAVARILPQQYRGVYSQCEEREEALCG